ncbi:MAG: MauE/DoxX family redox-associated membrane protein [Halioglobus sp.]
MALDITVSLVLRVLLAFIFVRAAVHKARNFKQFLEQLDDYELLPPGLLPEISLLIIVTESALALTLPVPVWSFPPLLAAALLGAYAFAMGINLARGRIDLDCGCAGPAEFSPGLSWALVIRNSVLVLLALAAAMPITERTLSLQDMGTVTVASLAAILLYSVAEV